MQTAEADVARDHWLKIERFRILRFWNHEALRNRDEVWQKIIEELISPARTLPTRGREGKSIKTLYT